MAFSSSFVTVQSSAVSLPSGVNDAEMRLCRGDAPWIGTDRPSIVRTLESLLYGSLDVLGLPRIRIPAEYVASVLVTVVKPLNIALACSWMQREGSAALEALVTSAEVGGNIEPVSAERLFALCCELYDTTVRSEASASFDRRMDIAVQVASQKGS